jgi:TM2 domain-containing membrane protein YozV
MLLIFLIFALLPGSAIGRDYYSPENILKFADHLYQEKDYLRAAGEYQRYLFYSTQNADSVLYKIGLCYRLAGETEKAISYFCKIAPRDSDSPLRFTAAYQIAYTYFLDGQHENSLQYLSQFMDDTKNPDNRGKLQILAAFNYLYQKRWSDAEHVLDSIAARDENLNLTASSLNARAREGMNLPRKIPIMAGLFSAVIPGTGKIYCGEYGDGIYSLIITGITGWLAWDGFRENGIRSVRGWVFGSVCGVFYAGNVYGSAIAARIHNHRQEADLLKRLPSVPYE